MAVIKKIEVEMAKIEKYNDSVCTLTMKPFSKLPEFYPGQFLHLTLDPYIPSSQWPESRVFSIQSSPTRNDEIKITYAVKGKFTRRMFDSLRKGDRTWIKLPYGNFAIRENKFKKILIAGGTGITPFLSYLTKEVDNPSNSQIHLFYGVRNEKYIIFTNELDEYNERLNNYSLTMFSEEINNVEYNFEEGRLNIDRILQLSSGAQEKEYYISGPPQMIQKFISQLTERKVSRENIFIDAWE